VISGQQDSQRTYQIILEARSRNRLFHGKEISITYYERISVVLGIQHAMRMCSITYASVACPDIQPFSTLLHNR
jgi:hypothetical protein